MVQEPAELRGGHLIVGQELRPLRKTYATPSRSNNHATGADELKNAVLFLRESLGRLVLGEYLPDRK
jgi:hypothetical protein